MKHVTLYTRGICNGANTGGYGIILCYQTIRKELSGSCEKTTNNRMDILAAITGLEALKEPCKVTIYNTNTYLIDAMAKGWVARWKANCWRNSAKEATPNIDLWERLLLVCQPHDIEFIWIKYSSYHPEYKRCDELAKYAIMQ